MDPQEELDKARRLLFVAFERARAVGYRPDSPEMQELAAAEEEWQRVRQRHRP